MPAYGESVWHIMPDYDLLTSRYPYCSVTGLPKREGDVGVFRPVFEVANIEGEGAFDISQLAIEEAAQLLGWHRPEALDEATAELKRKNAELFSKTGVQSKKISRLEAQVAELTAQLEAVKGPVE